MRPQGKVTVKYDRKELRKRLNLEEWVLEQLTRLYDCQEEEIPELEIDVDELLVTESDNTRAARVKELLVDCYKPTEVRKWLPQRVEELGVLSSWGLVSLMSFLPPGLHLWPAGQDPGHAEAEHTPEEVRVLDPAERWLHRTIAAPRPHSNSNTRGPCGQAWCHEQGSLCPWPRGLFLAPSAFHFGVFFIIKLMGLFVFLY